MSSIYQTQRAFADEYMPQIKALLGQSLFQEASLDDDTKHGTDLTIRNLRIAVRIRRTGYNAKYNDFTIRVTTQTNSQLSEYAKLLKLDGKSPNYIFYGFLEADRIIRAYLIDVSLLRQEIRSGLQKKFVRNPDHSSFLAFPLKPTYCKTLVIG